MSCVEKNLSYEFSRLNWSDLPARKRAVNLDLKKRIYCQSKKNLKLNKTAIKRKLTLSNSQQINPVNLRFLKKNSSFELFSSKVSDLNKKPLVLDKLKENHAKIQIIAQQKVRLVKEDFISKIEKSLSQAENDIDGLSKIKFKVPFDHPQGFNLFHYVKAGDLLQTKKLLEDFPDLKNVVDSVIFK